MTPRQIVTELDRYIVGQDAAKRAVAIAIRNRWRRQQLAPELRKDITPKNIIVIGPTKGPVKPRSLPPGSRPRSLRGRFLPRSKPPSTPKSATMAATSRA